MTTIFQVSDIMRRYFSERDIDTEGLTVVMNFIDFQSAAKFDSAVRKDLLSAQMHDRPGAELRGIKLNGIALTIESPVHVRVMG